jgi:hypothetical protein
MIRSRTHGVDQSQRRCPRQRTLASTRPTPSSAPMQRPERPAPLSGSASSRERSTRCRSPAPGRRQHLAKYHLEETMVPTPSLPCEGEHPPKRTLSPKERSRMGIKELGLGFVNRRSLPEGSHILPSHVAPWLRRVPRSSLLKSVDTPEKTTSSGVETRRITHHQQPRSDECGGSLHIFTPKEAPTRLRRRQTPEEIVATPSHSRRTDTSHQ